MGALERITVEVSTEVADAMRRSVDDGEYASADQIVDDVLHEWIMSRGTDQAEIERLRRLVDEGDASGPSISEDEVFAHIEAVIAKYDQPR